MATWLRGEKSSWLHEPRMLGLTGPTMWEQDCDPGRGNSSTPLPLCVVAGNRTVVRGVGGGSSPDTLPSMLQGVTEGRLCAQPVTQPCERSVAAETLANETKQITEWRKLVYVFASLGAERDK